MYAVQPVSLVPLDNPVNLHITHSILIILYCIKKRIPYIYCYNTLINILYYTYSTFFLYIFSYLKYSNPVETILVSVILLDYD